MPVEIGALLRSEGVYSSSLRTWRRQRESAGLEDLAPKKRGPKLIRRQLGARRDIRKHRSSGWHTKKSLP